MDRLGNKPATGATRWSERTTSGMNLAIVPWNGLSARKEVRLEAHWWIRPPRSVRRVGGWGTLPAGSPG